VSRWNFVETTLERFQKCLLLLVVIYETVKSAFAVNNLAVLQDCWADLWKNIDAKSESSLEQLLDTMSSTNFGLSRNIGAEIYIPKSVRDRKDKVK
jgi:hypothetical protein